MFISCDTCGYDSGDQTSIETLLVQIIHDGGTMEQIPDQLGWDIVCPNGHSGECIHMD
jgi:hypothetical protein